MLLDEDKRIKVVFDVFFNAQDYDEANELNKKIAFVNWRWRVFAAIAR